MMRWSSCSPISTTSSPFSTPVDIRDIHADGVHVHDAGDRRLLGRGSRHSAEVAEPTIEAMRIAHGYHRDTHVLQRLTACPVAR